MTEAPERTQRWDPGSPTNRRRISVGVVVVTLALLLILLPGTLLLIFAGLLLAVLLRTCGGGVAHALRIPPVWGVALFLVAAIAAVTLAGMALAPSISTQIDALWRQIPSSLDVIRKRAEDYAWAETLIDRIGSQDLEQFASRGAATSAVTSAFGYVGNTVIVIFIAIYGALDPGTYRRGCLALFAPSLRPRVGEVLSRSVATLQQWLMAKLIAMTVVGVLTGVGLWFVGIPLALVLGLIAGLLAFIPNLGPVIAAVPGLLLALPQGSHTLLLVLGVYLAVQTLESYVITPIIQQQRVSLPPLLVISAQLVFGSLFGLIGLALATPLAALAIRLTDDLYVKAYLEGDPPEGLG
ncbi:putative PurR-regulated permease PerM [Hoeflea marina]|uniref:Putative PurR-regulated permease PerM n=1 Tax=Hoeflea marina TaxID=274592 RepID=A0A317PXA3_9HYPH|nr:AI-2E family transporter [Hoeflea marina]PWW04130.1 putative PurR-regulated permease PerM [Hoeflea marina]